MRGVMEVRAFEIEREIMLQAAADIGGLSADAAPNEIRTMTRGTPGEIGYLALPAGSDEAIVGVGSVLGAILRPAGVTVVEVVSCRKATMDDFFSIEAVVEVARSGF